MALTSSNLRNRDSGQALVEAAIGLSLMAFAWTLAFYAAYMVNHAGQCVVAARYAAWSNGNGREIDAPTIRTELFKDNSSLVQLETGEILASGNSSLLGKSSDIVQAIGNLIFSVFPRIHQATVTFGVAPDQEPHPWPFSLLSVQFPFMPEPRLTEWMTVSATCEWDEVHSTWQGIDLGKIIGGFIGKDRDDLTNDQYPKPDDGSD